MTKTELTKSLRNKIFADRPTIEEAYDYAWRVANATDNPGAVMVALQVLVNTIANEVERGEV